MKNTMYQDEIEIDLKELILVVVKRLWLILAIGVIAAGSCYYIMLQNIVPYYKADTSIYILYRNEETKLLVSDMQTGNYLTSDYKKLITSRSVLEKVIETLDLDITYNSLCDKMEIMVETDTRILTIAIQDEDPDMAMEIANTIREIATDYINSVMRIEAVTDIDIARRPGCAIVPNSKKNSAIAGILASFVVTGCIVLIHLLSETITREEEIEERLGLPVLVTIPEIKEKQLIRKHKRDLIRERKIYKKELLREYENCNA